MKTCFRILPLVLVFYLSPSFAQNPVNASYAGTPDGPFEDYFMGGRLRTKCEIKNGNLQGDRFSYYKSGKLFVKEQFDNGEFHGMNYSLDQNGDTIYIEVYRHDSLLFSKNKWYYKNRALEYVTATTYILDSTMRKGVFPGKQKRRGIVINESKIEEAVHNNSIEIAYYPNGKMKTYMEFKNGLHNGLYVQFHENGEKKQESQCVMGKYEGPYYEYYPTGAIKVKAFNKNDYYHGDYLLYDKKGVVVKKITYVEGVKQTEENAK